MKKTLFGEKRFVFVEGPANKPETADRSTEVKAEKPSDVATPEGRAKVYERAQTKINELRQKGDEASKQRAESLAKRLQMAQDDEKAGGVGDPKESAQRLLTRLESVSRQEQKSSTMTPEERAANVAKLAKLDKETEAVLKGEKVPTGAVAEKGKGTMTPEQRAAYSAQLDKMQKEAETALQPPPKPEAVKPAPIGPVASRGPDKTEQGQAGL